jgi:hypothetical protein
MAAPAKFLRAPYVTIRTHDDHVTMSRRFLVPVCAAVCVNAFFWLAQSGFALPRSLIDRFFGPRMIRAEVIVQGPAGGINDFRLDRGVIVATNRRSLTLRELDGTTVTIPVAPGARVTGSPSVTGVADLRPPMRVLVVRRANARAKVIEVEGTG